jgi:hypothetical protein
MRGRRKKYQAAETSMKTPPPRKHQPMPCVNAVELFTGPMTIETPAYKKTAEAMRTHPQMIGEKVSGFGCITCD